MATSPIYSWPEPDNTDLVKNGALAIRTLGNAIDTTMGTMVAKTIIDAKGDLIAGTAADTAARLAVGANDTILVGDSTAATGLAYKSSATLYAYTTWTPTLGGITIGNGTVSARYAKIGKTVNFNLSITLGTTSLVTGRITFTLPSSPIILTHFTGAMTSGGGTDYLPYIFNVGSTVYCDVFNVSGTYASAVQASATVPLTWGSGNVIFVNGTYQEA